jgi:hypothetical protein
MSKRNLFNLVPQTHWKTNKKRRLAPLFVYFLVNTLIGDVVVVDKSVNAGGLSVDLASDLFSEMSLVSEDLFTGFVSSVLAGKNLLVSKLKFLNTSVGAAVGLNFFGSFSGKTSLGGSDFGVTRVVFLETSLAAS